MKCTFCGKEIATGRGLIVVKHDGTSTYYCSAKCESSNKVYLKTKRNKRAGRNVKWTSTYQDLKQGKVKNV